jgi:hypothetical protein
MSSKPIDQKRNAWLTGALPALRRVRQRAEQIARRAGNALISAKDGIPVRVSRGPAGNPGHRNTVS